VNGRLHAPAGPPSTIPRLSRARAAQKSLFNGAQSLLRTSIRLTLEKLDRSIARAPAF
jgi:hypothetical protein